MLSGSGGKIAAAFIGTTAIVAIDGIQRGKVTPRIFVGSTAAFLLVSFLAVANDELAVALAFLVFVAVFLTRGVRVFGKLGRVFS